MSLVVGTNSWELVSEADTYLTDRLNASDWFDLSDTSTPGNPSKEVYLITAFRELINYPGTSLTADLTDDSVKEAQTEMALWLIKFNDDAERRKALISMGVTSFTASRDWKETLSEYGLPQQVYTILVKSGYLIGSGGGIITFEGEDDT